jgi:hypothetical protein
VIQRLFGAIFVLTIISLQGQAQLLTNPVQDYINKTTLLNNILSNQRAIEMSQRGQTNGGSTNRKTAGKTPQTTPGAAAEPTKFAASAAPILPKLLSEKSSSEAAKQREAQQYFQSLLGLYRQTAQKDGFDANDLAYAFEYFVVNSYMLYHDLIEVDYNKDPRIQRGNDSLDRLRLKYEKDALKVTISQERAVYHQFKSLLSSNPGVLKMSGQEKQELSELLAIMFGVNFSLYMKGVNQEHPPSIEQAHATAKLYLEKLIGAPIGNIRIGDQGMQQN